VTTDGAGSRLHGARALVGPGALLTVAVVAANGLNAVFQFALARILSPAEYSLLAALVVITLVAAVPPVAFQASVARETALLLAENREADAGAVLRSTLRGVLVAGAVLIVLAAAIYPLLSLAGPRAPAATLATVATAAAALAIPPVWGALQGATLFGALSWAQLLFSGSRLAVGVVIAAAGGDAAAVMGGVAVATIVTLLVSLLPLRPLWRAAAAATTAPRRLATRANVAAAVGLTILTAVTSIDLVIANLAFDGDTAGAYAAASVGARVLLLVPIGITTVLFPRVATLRDPRRERRHLLVGVASVAATGAAVTAFLWGAAGPLIDLAFGEKYSAAADWLGPLALAMALYGVANVYLFHFLSLGRARYAIALVGVFVVQLLAFALFHASPGQLVGVQIAIGTLTVLSGEGWYQLVHHRAVTGAT
jgi:O-antigen/teichoic acid export membrane protein